MDHDLSVIRFVCTCNNNLEVETGNSYPVNQLIVINCKCMKCNKTWKFVMGVLQPYVNEIIDEPVQKNKIRGKVLKPTVEEAVKDLLERSKVATPAKKVPVKQNNNTRGKIMHSTEQTAKNYLIKTKSIKIK